MSDWERGKGFWGCFLLLKIHGRRLGATSFGTAMAQKQSAERLKAARIRTPSSYKQIFVVSASALWPIQFMCKKGLSVFDVGDVSFVGIELFIFHLPCHVGPKISLSYEQTMAVWRPAPCLRLKKYVLDTIANQCKPASFILPADKIIPTDAVNVWVYRITCSSLSLSGRLTQAIFFRYNGFWERHSSW